MTDPLDLMNEFMTRPPEVPAFPYDYHWQKKVAIMCEELAKLRDENVKLREKNSLLAPVEEAGFAFWRTMAEYHRQKMEMDVRNLYNEESIDDS